MNPSEQTPKMMPTEQLPLDFDDHAKPPLPETNKTAVETSDEETLRIRYRQAVGKDPAGRGLSQEQLIAGIQDPKAEWDRLAAIDRESDKEDLRGTYVR